MLLVAGLNKTGACTRTLAQVLHLRHCAATLHTPPHLLLGAPRMLRTAPGMIPPTCPTFTATCLLG